MLRQPFPDVADILVGLLLVVVGLTLFVRGLEMGLFPIGETMAEGFARKGSLFWLMVFAFCLGFGTTAAWSPRSSRSSKKLAEVHDQRPAGSPPVRPPKLPMPSTSG